MVDRVGLLLVAVELDNGFGTAFALNQEFHVSFAAGCASNRDSPLRVLRVGRMGEM